jgi:hypothetical protein
MSLEPTPKNFKDEYKIKELVKKKIIIRPHVYISGFLMTLLSGTSKLVTQYL